MSDPPEVRRPKPVVTQQLPSNNQVWTEPYLRPYGIAFGSTKWVVSPTKPVEQVWLKQNDVKDVRYVGFRKSRRPAFEVPLSEPLSKPQEIDGVEEDPPKVLSPEEVAQHNKAFNDLLTQVSLSCQSLPSCSSSLPRTGLPWSMRQRVLYSHSRWRLQQRPSIPRKRRPAISHPVGRYYQQ